METQNSRQRRGSPKAAKFKIQKLRLKLKIKKTFAFLLVVLTFSFCLFNFAEVSAQTSANKNYIIEIGDINTSPNSSVIVPKSDEEDEETVEENAAPKIGIESIVQTAPLSFSLSGALIDFGSLNPNNPVTRTVLLSVMSTANDFQVISYENHPLTGASSTDILPDTTCDQGKCDEVHEAVWTNNLTYGFGYRCTTLTYLVCAAFSEGEYFKQFADFSKGEQPQTVGAGKKNQEKQDAEIMLKVNSSGTQKAESYTNAVTFIAVPNF